MELITRQDLGEQLVIELNKLELSLQDSRVTNGILLDYGSGLKEYICSIDTRITKAAIQQGNRYIYYDFFTHNLPVTFREILNIQANLVGSDILLQKICTGKRMTNNSIRIDYSGTHSASSISATDKQVTIHLRVLGRM